MVLRLKTNYSKTGKIIQEYPRGLYYYPPDFLLKVFLLAFSKGDPDWSKLDYSKFPAVKWKLLNINKLKIIDPQKYSEQVAALKQILAMP
jgi:hypothetical protein